MQLAHLPPFNPLKTLFFYDVASQLNSNSGIQTITLEGASPGANPSFYYKVGHTVTVYLDFTPSTSGAVVTVAILPSGYRPPSAIRVVPGVVDGANSGTSFVAVQSDGRIQCYMESTKRVFISLTYAV